MSTQAAPTQRPTPALGRRGERWRWQRAHRVPDGVSSRATWRRAEGAFCCGRPAVGLLARDGGQGRTDLEAKAIPTAGDLKVSVAVHPPTAIGTKDKIKQTDPRLSPLSLVCPRCRCRHVGEPACHNSPNCSSVPPLRRMSNHLFPPSRAARPGPRPRSAMRRQGLAHDRR